MVLGFPGGSVIRNSLVSAGDARDMCLIPESGRICWRRKWQPAPVFLPGKFHGQSSLAGYSTRGHKELDTTEHIDTNTQNTISRTEQMTVSSSLDELCALWQTYQHLEAHSCCMCTVRNCQTRWTEEPNLYKFWAPRTTTEKSLVRFPAKI